MLIFNVGLFKIMFSYVHLHIRSGKFSEELRNTYEMSQMRMI